LSKTTKKLVLHSDQVSGKTQIDEAFLKFFEGRKPKIAYIPSQSDSTRMYFNQKVEWYHQFGIDGLFYFDIDQEYKEGDIPELLSCDAIHLSGGNTYNFLNSLKKRGLISKLQNFVEQGGVLIGVSAGSIVMSRTIAVTTIDENIGGDQNTIELKDFSGLGLNDFEFFPHFNKDNPEIVKRIKEYSIKSKSTIYTWKDGDGIIIDGNNMRFFGQVLQIKNGEISMM